MKVSMRNVLEDMKVSRLKIVIMKEYIPLIEEPFWNNIQEADKFFDEIEFKNKIDFENQVNERLQKLKENK